MELLENHVDGSEQDNTVLSSTPVSLQSLGGQANAIKQAGIRRIRNRIANELLLARLFVHHPDHAMAALKGIEPVIVDMIEPARHNVVPLPVDQRDANKFQDRPSSTLVLMKVAEFYGFQVDDLKSRRKNRDLTFARHVSMYLMRYWCGYSCPMIGSIFGKSEHSTATAGSFRIRKLCADNERLRDEMEVLKLRLTEAMLNGG